MTGCHGPRLLHAAAQAAADHVRHGPERQRVRVGGQRVGAGGRRARAQRVLQRRRHDLHRQRACASARGLARLVG